MAGLYIHIPFCKSRCIYCGFYSTTNDNLSSDYVDCLIRELDLRKNETTLPWETIYLGGGTPSQLPASELERLFAAIDHSQATEITMECNPDDITPEYAALLSRLPIIRVSMGAQTFSDERLRFIHRRHNASQVQDAVDRLRHAGIHNISIDLMYGFPNETIDEWQSDIIAALALSPEHISAYCLSYEDGTPLYRLLESGKVQETDEETSRLMYETLIDRLEQAGYEHYEISNFARPGFRSRHNSSYWNDIPYTGIGAAAHSYTGSAPHNSSASPNNDAPINSSVSSHHRQPARLWNVSNLHKYISSIKQGILPQEQELLDSPTLYNDMVMLSLRTREGINLSTLRSRFGEDYYNHCMKMAQKFIDSGLLVLDNDSSLTLSRQGLFVSDMIMAELFY